MDFGLNRIALQASDTFARKHAIIKCTRSKHIRTFRDHVIKGSYKIEQNTKLNIKLGAGADKRAGAGAGAGALQFTLTWSMTRRIIVKVTTECHQRNQVRSVSDDVTSKKQKTEGGGIGSVAGYLHSAYIAVACKTKQHRE